MTTLMDCGHPPAARAVTPRKEGEIVTLVTECWACRVQREIDARPPRMPKKGDRAQW